MYYNYVSYYLRNNFISNYYPGFHIVKMYIYLILKQVIRELDSGHQLENVNKLKIVQYQYKPEYLNQQRYLRPEDDQSRFRIIIYIWWIYHLSFVTKLLDFIFRYYYVSTKVLPNELEVSIILLKFILYFMTIFIP